MSRQTRRLGSTYRLQLPGVGFAGAAEIVPFLADLGIETLYVSPVTRARAGSRHGYDVTDPTEIDPELGGRSGYDSLLAALGDAGMRLLIDIVPNHMAASVDNPMFADVLRHGRRSQFASYFDISWDTADSRIVLPLLDGSVSDALRTGVVGVERTGSSYRLRCRDTWLPIDPAGEEALLADLAGVKRLDDLAARREAELVLARQHYRLVDWHTAGETVNYRRFFDINDLIGLRQEDPAVFEATHRLVVELARDPRVAGLRVDHVDGMRDPAGYLAKLRSALDDVAGDGPRPAIVVEKILERDERLPDWPVQGSTGYDFCAHATGLLVAGDGARAAADAIAAATGDGRSFTERAVAAKLAALEQLFPSLLRRTADRIAAAMTPGGPPLEHADVVDAVRDVSSRLRVYRTYRRHDRPPSEADSDRITAAVEAARHDLDGGANPAIDPVSAVLHGPLPDGSAAWDAVAHWQQLTAPVVAKGVEDSALYAPGTLLVSADVGSDPDRPATTPEEMHSFLARRRESWPATMNALSTHDSKRGHDVRCRLAVLSEMAKDWEAVVAELDAGRDGDPDAVDRRYAYETIVGAWPAGGADEDFARRVREHLVKAAREAKRCTSWLWPEAKYEQALEEFADSVLGDATARDIVAGVVGTIDRAAITNSLASVVLRAAAPGAPDVYQGDDLRQLVLVDPDNRRRPDLDRHRDALSSLPAAATPELAGLLPDWSDGRIKQAVLRASLHARRANPQLFDEGDYLPLDVHGSEQAHLFAFARRLHDHAAVCVVPRLPYTLAGADAFAVGGVWRDTAIELGELTGLPLVDVLTGRGLEPDGRQVAADLLDVLPVALLVTAG